MKIINIDESEIRFNNDSYIKFDHCADSYEKNYADFEYLKEELGGAVYEIEFQNPLVFEGCEYGFRFGNDGSMFFVPCYSRQDGYYSCNVDIYYNDDWVLNCEGAIE